MSSPARLAPVLAALKKPKSWLLLGLGFSAGLPFLLVGSTLGMWMRRDGASLTLIGIFSGISLWYGTKVLWAPFMDKVRLPLLYGWLGQRRSYMLLAQALIALGLVLMATAGPKSLLAFLLAGILVAFAAVSQEIAIDAWRVEETESDADQALNPTFYNFGYRTGILVTNSLVLFLSDSIGWAASYKVMALCMVIGVAATFAAPRTEVEQRPQAEARTARQLLIDPFDAFWREHGGVAMTILLFTAFYRLPDYVLGPVVGPMYEDTGISNTAIGALRGTVGLAASYAGIALGGGCVLWLGLQRALWLGLATTFISKLGFAWMSLAGGDIGVFATVLVADDLSNGIAETAMVAFMTCLTGRGFTLTHYALLYSVMAFSGKFLKLFSGAIIDAIKPDMGLFPAYAVFFAGCGVVGLPAAIWLWRMRQKGVFSRN